jgi:putative acetyltransferase
VCVDVREAVPDDAASIRDVHLASIEGLAGEAYDETQVAAWAHDRSPEDYPISSSDTVFRVAERDGRIVGFGQLRPDAGEYLDAPVAGEITAVYVQPSVARCGVGTALCDALEAAARRLDVGSLGVWASLNAVPFYEAQGYQRVTTHTVEYADGVELPVVELTKALRR